MSMRKIRVLQVVPSFALGGAERMAVHLMTKLSSQKFEIAAISMYDPVGTDLEELLDKRKIPVFYLGKKLGFDMKMYWRIFRVICKYKPDVVHTHLSVLRYLLPILIFKNIKVKIHTVHNIAEKEVDSFGKFVHGLAFIVGVVPVSIAKEVAQSMDKVYGVGNTPLIPNGIPLETYAVSKVGRSQWRKSEGIGEEELLFVIVGRLSKQKNHSLLLDAFSKMENINKKKRLLIVGDGELRQSLQEQVKSLNLEKEVLFLGMRTDIPEVLEASDVFVLSSSWEGNPLTVMEAMAAGKTVVSTAVGGVPELVVDGLTGLLVPAENPIALTEALNKTLLDEELRGRLGLEAAKYAQEHFSDLSMTKKYEQLYEKTFYS